MTDGTAPKGAGKQAALTRAKAGKNPLRALRDVGQSIWLDYIHRGILRSGELRRFVEDDGISGVTSNPTIFEKAITGSTDYDAALAALVAEGKTAAEIYETLVVDDIRGACDVLRPQWEASNGVDGRVSIEVDPRLAKNTAATIAEARALWWAVDRPNLFIKIPATIEGLPAITQAISEGISVNVTLIFALARYGEVIDAYMTGLEQAAAAGHDLSRIRSVASFFVSRVDTEVDARLDKIGTPEAAQLRGKAAVANARLAYELFETKCATERWQALAAKGARVQRPLWASTSTKDPAFPDTMYVVELVVSDTVNTMPEATIKATADHGELRGDTVHGTYDQSRQLIADLELTGQLAVVEEDGFDGERIKGFEARAPVLAFGAELAALGQTQVFRRERRILETRTERRKPFQRPREVVADRLGFEVPVDPQDRFESLRW